MNRNLFSMEKSFIATGTLYCKACLVPSQLIFFNYSSPLPPPLHPGKKEKRLGIKIASCLISNKEWGVRMWRLTDVKEGWWCHSLSPGPPKGEQKSKNNFHYLATCFHLFTRLILNAAIPIILAERFSVSQKPEFCWSIKNNEYVVAIGEI